MCFTRARRMRVSFYLPKAGRPQGRAGPRRMACSCSHIRPLPPRPHPREGNGTVTESSRRDGSGCPRQPRNRPGPPRAGAAGPPLSPHAPLAESFGVRPPCGRRRRATPIATPCAYPAAPAAAAPDRRARQPPSHRPPFACRVQSPELLCTRINMNILLRN